MNFKKEAFNGFDDLKHTMFYFFNESNIHVSISIHI